MRPWLFAAWVSANHALTLQNNKCNHESFEKILCTIMPLIDLSRSDPKVARANLFASKREEI
jgi:hypothetical protein